MKSGFLKVKLDLKLKRCQLIKEDKGSAAKQYIHKKVVANSFSRTEKLDMLWPFISSKYMPNFDCLATMDKIQKPIHYLS